MAVPTPLKFAAAWLAANALNGINITNRFGEAALTDEVGQAGACASAIMLILPYAMNFRNFPPSVIRMFCAISVAASLGAGYKMAELQAPVPGTTSYSSSRTAPAPQNDHAPAARFR